MLSPSVPRRRIGRLGTASAQPGMAGMTVQYPLPVPNSPLHTPPIINTNTHDRLILPGTCKFCKRGQFQMCDTEEINGVTRDGGCKSSLTTHIVRCSPLSPHSCRRRICALTDRSRRACPQLRGPCKVRPFALCRRHGLRRHAFLAYPSW